MANDIGLFLPPDDKLLLGYIDSNYDQDSLVSIIRDQQELEIKKLIGSGLYDEIEGQIIAQNVSVLNATLRVMINDALRHFVLADWQFEATAKNTNKGSQTLSGEYSQRSEIAMLAQRVQRYKDKAQVYADRVSKYLCENSQSYPLYYNPGSGIDTIHPSDQNFSTGWAMGGTHRRNYLDQP